MIGQLVDLLGGCREILQQQTWHRVNPFQLAPLDAPLA